MRTIRIHQGKTFPISIRIFIAIFSTMAIIQVLLNFSQTIAIPLSIFLSILLPGFWFSTKLFEINRIKKIIFKGSWIMGFRFGKCYTYKDLSLQMRKVQIKKTVFEIDNKNLLTDHEYQAYIIIDGKEELYLFGHPLEKRIKEKIKFVEKKIGQSN